MEIYFEGSSGNSVLKNSIVRNNSSEHGGGIAIHNGAKPKIINTLIEGNIASANGGGAILASQTSTFVNCTITGNSAADGQGSSGLHFNHSDPNDFIDIINTSIHGNAGNNLLAEFYIGGGVNISYSNVGGGFASIEYTDSYQGTVNWGTGNVDVEPKFINSEENNFHLLASSMLINGGHPDSLDSDGTATDIEHILLKFIQWPCMARIY